MMDSNTPRSQPQEPLSRVGGGAEEPVQCLFCDRPFQLWHRRTKKFCGDLCRSRYHYARRQAAQADLKRQLQEAQARLRRLEDIPGDTAGRAVE